MNEHFHQLLFLLNVIEEWCTWRFVLFIIKTGALICQKLKLPLWNAHAAQNVQADENRICLICFETFLICLGYITYSLLYDFSYLYIHVVRKSSYIILIGWVWGMLHLWVFQYKFQYLKDLINTLWSSSCSFCIFWVSF